MDYGMDEARTLSGLETMREGGSMWLAGRYKVVRRLGEGGMGSVWLAEDTKLDNRQVAVKMLPAVLAGKKGAYRQVKQEALMAMKLAHPNIATVRAFEEDEGGAPFLVMDYIEGTGLDEILAEKGALGEAETLKLLGPVAAALDYAHAKGVVHRDVKPGNVIVDRNGTPFVLDFGIAREIQETMTRVTGKFSSGTLMYMSPEQLNGRAPKAAQDVYSFAAMAYECLTGAPPFSRGQIEWQIVNNPPEPLPEDAAGEALRQGVMAGLAKEPEKRPGTCMGVLAKGRASQGGASTPCEPENGTAAGRTAGRSAGKVAGTTARSESSPHQKTTARPEGSPHHQGPSEAERALREAEARAEMERRARREAEAEAREARRRAQAEELAVQQAQEARGRATGWAWFLAIVLVVGGLVAYGVWQQEQERSQAELRQLQRDAADQRKAANDAQQELARQKAEAQRKAKDEALQELERQRSEAEAQAKARQEAEAQRRAQQEAEAKRKAEAERKAEQERQMKPSILLKATLNGSEVAATVTEGLARSGLTTPVTVNLEVGGSYGFAAEYEAGGKKYAGRTTVQAKDRGVTEAAVALVERPAGQEGSSDILKLDMPPQIVTAVNQTIPLKGDGWGVYAEGNSTVLKKGKETNLVTDIWFTGSVGPDVIPQTPAKGAMVPGGTPEEACSIRLRDVIPDFLETMTWTLESTILIQYSAPVLETTMTIAGTVSNATPYEVIIQYRPDGKGSEEPMALAAHAVRAVDGTIRLWSECGMDRDFTFSERGGNVVIQVQNHAWPRIRVEFRSGSGVAANDLKRLLFNDNGRWMPCNGWARMNTIILTEDLFGRDQAELIRSYLRPADSTDSLDNYDLSCEWSPERLQTNRGTVTRCTVTISRKGGGSAKPKMAAVTNATP